jgi:hypothetical protein
VRTAWPKPVRPRLISFDRDANFDTTGDGAVTVHQKPIMLQTKSHWEPYVPFLREERQAIRGVEYDVFEGIIACHAREYGGNVRDRHVAEVTSGLRERDLWAKKHNCAKKAADLKTDSVFDSAW